LHAVVCGATTVELEKRPRNTGAAELVAFRAPGVISAPLLEFLLACCCVAETQNYQKHRKNQAISHMHALHLKLMLHASYFSKHRGLEQALA